MQRLGNQVRLGGNYRRGGVVSQLLSGLRAQKAEDPGSANEG